LYTALHCISVMLLMSSYAHERICAASRDHPDAYERIIKLLKERVGTEYDTYATLFLNKTLEECKAFEKTEKTFTKCSKNQPTSSMEFPKPLLFPKANK